MWRGKPRLHVRHEFFARRAMFGEIEGFFPADAVCFPVCIFKQSHKIAQGGKGVGVRSPDVGKFAGEVEACPVEHEKIIGNMVSEAVGEWAIAEDVVDKGVGIALENGTFMC